MLGNFGAVSILIFVPMALRQPYGNSGSPKALRTIKDEPVPKSPKVQSRRVKKHCN